MEVLAPGRLAAANLPRTIESDRPGSHSDAIERVFGADVWHVRSEGMTGEMNDNLPQRPQGQFRVRAKGHTGPPEPTGRSAVPGGLGHQQHSVRPPRGVGRNARPAGIATMSYETAGGGGNIVMGRDFMNKRSRFGLRTDHVYNRHRTYYGLYTPGGGVRRASVNVRRATGAQQPGSGNTDRRSVRGRVVNPNDRLLRREEVEARCGIARSTIYRLMNEGLFPQPLRIGGRAVRWLESEIIVWQASLPRATG